MDVLQEIEFVPNDMKLTQLLEALQKVHTVWLQFCQSIPY